MRMHPNAGGAGGGGGKRRPPVVKIRVALIDPEARTVVLKTIVMHPQVIQQVLGKQSVAWAKIGDAKTVDVMFAGDKLPQIAMLGDAEAEYEVTDQFGKPGPICHGKGMVFGFAVAAKKATSLPVDLQWVVDRVKFLGEVPAQAPDGA